MASFIGTFDEFIKYINPRAKNVVNSITRNYKSEKGKCEHCGSTANTLEAAHVTGRERPKIIEEILDEFRNGEIITVDLEVFENLFLQAHDPINEIILVLCRTCHNEYDSKQQETIISSDFDEITAETVDKDQLMSNSQITDAIRELVPRLDDQQVDNLLDLNYCNKTFKISYPVLKEIPLYSNQEEIRKLAQVSGHNRWSTQRPIIRNKSCYIVTTQWTDRHRVQFKNWYSQVNA